MVRVEVLRSERRWLATGMEQRGGFQGHFSASVLGLGRLYNSMVRKPGFGGKRYGHRFQPYHLLVVRPGPVA